MCVSFARLVEPEASFFLIFDLVAYTQPKGAYKGTRAVCAVSTTAG